MLRPSFVPPPQIRLLRDLTRYRLDLVNVRTAEKNRVEKLLEDAQIKLSVVASDIFGVSGREMMARLIAGERDPKALAQLARASMRRKIVLLEEAFVGRFTDHHAFLLRTMLARIDETSADIAAIETRIEELIAPFAQTVARLDEITGVGVTAAHTMIAEIGLDMSRFPTAAHLCSWARFAPGIKQSAGKSKGRGSTGHGNPYLARVLGEAAVGASRTDTFLGERYRRIARRVLRPVSGQLCETTSGGLVDLISVSCCLSAAGIGFLGILSRRWSWSIVTSGLPPPVPVWRTPTGFPCSARMRHGWDWGRVGPPHCCGGPPSEPDLNGFHSSGSSKPGGPVGGSQFRTTCVAVENPARAVRVHEAECIGFIRRALPRVGDDRMFADRLASDLDPRFPFFWGLWLVVSVQQQAPAEWTAPALRLKKTQPGLVQRGFAAATPLGPVVDQSR